MRDPHNLTNVDDVLHSTAEGGEVRVNIGEETTGEGAAGDVQVWGPDGYIARPNDPSDKGVCQVLHVVEGQQRRVIASRDNRYVKQAGTLKPGDRMIVTDGPARFYVKQADQRVGFYTEAKSKPEVGGAGMMVDVNGASGDILIKRGGQTVVLGADGNLSLICAGSAAQSSIVMTPTTITITASIVNVAGQSVCLGINSDGTLPGKPGLDTVTIGSIGQMAVASPKVFAAQY